MNTLSASALWQSLSWATLIQDSSFTGSPSDSLDGDFCDGRIERSSFHNIGGDAVDFSGSQVELLDVRMSRVKDKAVSAGEGLQLVENAALYRMYRTSGLDCLASGEQAWGNTLRKSL